MNNHIAIVGIAGRFPEADTVQQFYQNLYNGKDSVRSIPLLRRLKTNIPVSRDFQPSACLENIDAFDYKFFNIALGEAQYIDPHQRILLEVVYTLFEDAGLTLQQINGTRTAVFVGDTQQEYNTLTEEENPMLLLGSLNATTAGRIARHFNLLGNAVMIDTACSSSLVAVHMACQELILRESEYAIVCGAKISVAPADIDTPDHSGIMSADGKSRTFSATASGTGGGEVVEAILLKRLDDAIRDKDNIHAIIRGSAVNQDAQRSSSLTAPSSIAQAEVMERAWQKAGIDPLSITYIEAHGTGTRLGDPIEIDGITRAFRKFTEHKQFCAVSSVKSNIGHTDTAAGLSGLIKVVLALRHKVLFPAVHFDEPNAFIDFVSSPVYVNTTVLPWDTGEQNVRRAGVSSFGISGTNCHVVLEEAPEVDLTGQEIEAIPTPYLFAVSSQTVEGLKDNVHALVQHVECQSLRPGDVSYTLGVHRNHFAHRAAYVACSVLEFVAETKTAIKTFPCRNFQFLFSGDTDMSLCDVDAFIGAFPRFAEVYHDCRQLFGENFHDADVGRLIFQFSLYRLFESLGIAGKKVAGTGVGKLAIGLLKGKLSWQEVMDRPSASGTEKVSYERIMEWINRLPEPNATGIVEMGPHGPVSGRIKNAGVSVLRFFQVEKPADVLSIVKECYEAGTDIHWHVLYDTAQVRRISLPGYRFARTSCWLQSQKSSEIAPWLYDLAWTCDNRAPNQLLAGKTYLFFMDDQGIGEALTTQLEGSGVRCIRAYSAERFAITGDNAFAFNLADESTHQTVLAFLDGLQADIDGIVHFGGCCGTEAVLSDDVDTALHRGLYSVFYATRLLDPLLRRKAVAFFMITCNARRVTGRESHHDAARSSIHGYAISLKNEYPLASPQCVDIDQADVEASAERMAMFLSVALCTNRDQFIMALREGTAYVQELKPAEAVSPAKSTSLALKRGGVYILTGGSRGIGLAMADYLGQQERVTLVILGLRSIPPRDTWATYPETGEWYETLQVFNRLTAADTEVYYHAVDVGDKEQLQTVLTAVRTRHGAIDGIIHSAGIPGKRRVRKHSIESFRETLLPKIHGSVNLYSLTRQDTLDFFIMFSSQNAIIGIDRGTNYSAANIFQDNFVHTLRQNGVNGMAVRWAFWRETGMGRRFHDFAGMNIGENQSLSNAEGIKVFSELLKDSRPEVVISKVAPASMGNNPYFVAQQYVADTDENVPVDTSHEVPVDATTDIRYNAQWTQSENAVATVWADVLRADTLARDDNFFQIGGHSLLGVRIINALEKKFGIELEFRDVLEYPTIQKLAAYIDKLRDSHDTVQYTSIGRLEQQEHYPLSQSQRSLWLYDRFQDLGNAYNISREYHFKGSLNKAALEQAFVRLIKRHESLRTTFVTVAGEARQRIHPHDQMDFAIAFDDVRNASDSEDAARQVAKAELAIPFSLDIFPLLRARLIRTGEDAYVFIFVVHHIISDGWSLQLMVNELLHHYNAVTTGAGDTLPSLRIQYRDYAVWHNRQLEGQRLEQHQAYWVEQFRGEIPVLDLPLDFPRPAHKTYNGERVYLQLPANVSQQVQIYIKQESVSLFMFLMTTVKALLSRYTGQSDIVIGSPLAGRDHSDLEDQIGCYVNTLPIRSKLATRKSFSYNLHQVEKNILSVYDHQAFTLERLAEDLGVKRERSRSLLFDVVLVLQDRDAERSHFAVQGDLAVSGYEAGVEKRRLYDLIFDFTEREEGIFLSLEYNSDLFVKRQAERMLLHFHTILEAILHNPAATLENLIYVNAVERGLLESFNHTITEYPRDTTVHALFEAQVLLHPEAEALRFRNTTMTYCKLNEMANRLAHCLRRQYGVTTGCLVAILLERSDAFVVAMLAILKAGGAYVPVDTSHPADRIKNVLEDANVNVLLLDSTFLPMVSEDFSGEIFAMDLQLETLDESLMNPEPIGKPMDPAYVMYTSGSTGRPKGVVVPHRGIIRLVSNTDYVQLHYGHKLLWTGALTFDASTFEIWGMLLGGGTLCILSHAQLMNVAFLKQYLWQELITHIWITSSWFNQLVEADITLFEKLICVLVGGERLSPPHISRLRQQYPLLKLVNGYGPTENTTFSVCHDIADPYEHDIPIGRPIANSTAYVLDGQQQLAGVGVRGELYLGGDGLALGYLNSPELTVSRFVPHPFEAGEQLYRSGDLARWRADGLLEFSGRADAQIKLRGYRIEPSEIAMVIKQNTFIRDAYAFLSGSGDEKYILAAIIPKDVLLASSPELHPEVIESARQTCRQHLPEYMIPSRFTVVEKFPLNGNGKIDHKILDKPLEQPIEAHSIPVGMIEEKLAAIWCDVLNQSFIGRDTNFFELGGHSLKAVQITAMVCKNMQAHIELKHLFEAPTIASLAKIVEASRVTAGDAISPIEQQDYYAMSHAQKRLWISAQLEEEGIAYNIPSAYILEGPLDVAAFQYAFDMLVQRHENLRTVFVTVEGTPVQKILPFEKLKFATDVTDLTAYSEQDSRVQALLDEAVDRSFDLKTGPLIRAQLVKLSEERFMFLLTMHHIISDGWSIQVLVDEVLEHYARYPNTLTAAPVPSMPIQYKDYAAWQNMYLRSEAQGPLRAFWASRFSETEDNLAGLPLDYSRPATRGYKGDCVHHTLDSEITNGLYAIAGRTATSLYMVILSAVYVLIYRYTGQSPVILGNEVSGRDHRDLHKLIGFFVNTLPLKIVLQAQDTFEDVLRQVRSAVLDALEHQAYPFDLMVDQLEIERERNRSPIFDIEVSFYSHKENAKDNPMETGITVTQLRQKVVSTKFDLSFVFSEDNDGVHVNLIYDRELFRPQSILLMQSRFINILKALAANSMTTIGSIKLTQPEAHKADEFIKIKLNF